MLKKLIYGILIFFGVLGILYAIGPKPNKPNLMAKIFKKESNLQKLEAQIIENERNTKGMRPDNEARIIWADTSKKIKTPYAFVYLPGFSASQFEGAPLHRNLAARYGANLYLARLYGHGVEVGDNLIDLTPENYLESAAEAIEIAKQLGEKVIVISTSTGGTLSLLLAAQDPTIHSLVMFSPNIAIADPAAVVLDEPWGLQIARTVHGGSDFHEFDAKDVDNFTKKYWSWRYRIEALVSLGSLMDHGMTKEVFEKVKCPVFLGYYYKNEAEQDPVVSVAAAKNMFTLLGTPSDKKVEIAFSEAKTHVIACQLRSKQYEAIEAATFKFCDEVLGIK